MTETDARPPGDLGDRLIAAEGLDEPGAKKTRKEAMRQILEEERAFTRKIRQACTTAWALSLLLPVGYLAQQLMVASSSPGAVTAWEWGVYLGTQLLMFAGAFGAVIGIITLVAWLFRTRSASLATLQVRVGELEEALAQLEREGTRQ